MTEASAATGRSSASVSPSDRPALTRHVRMHFDATREKHVLLMPETVVTLNPTGADILGLCDGERTVAEIVTELSGRYDRVVDDEVADFLDRLVRRRCVEIREQ